jgi:nicotinate-nucleotide adenylyltransferase
MNIGILGGTFDPPHTGHIAAARCVRDGFALDRVELLPAFQPPHKPGRPLSSPFHRYAMTVLATLEEDRVRASFLELERGGLSFTIDTLRARAAMSESDRIVFVLGTDQFAEMASWREPRPIVEEFGLIVVTRPGNGFSDALGRLPGWASDARASGRIREAVMDPVDVSSTTIRERIAGGLGISGLVAPAVSQYIERYGLYRSGG